MKIWSKDLLAVEKPKIAFPKGFRLDQHLREVRSTGGSNGRIFEFVGSDTFSDEWNQRQQFEVDAGRDMEPILYTPFYDVVNDPNLPELINIYKIGPGGVVFEEIFEGGEVKFMSVGSSEESLRIRHYGAGLEYSKDVALYNRLWDVAIVERQAGIAYNALLNNIAISPVLDYSYASSNQTGAVTTGATDQEDILLTIEAGITAAKNDTSNPRRGPYSLLISSAQAFRVEKALSRVPQEGVQIQSSAINMIQDVIVYDGWTGTRGGKSTTYAGVTSGKAYLIDKANKMMDFKFYMKQDLRLDGEDQDITRFLTQRVYDCYFGCYANVLRSTEEITLP
jgi:hypothetical protein